MCPNWCFSKNCFVPQKICQTKIVPQHFVLTNKLYMLKKRCCASENGCVTEDYFVTHKSVLFLSFEKWFYAS